MFSGRQKSSAIFYTVIAILTLLENCVLQSKNCNALSIFGCILEQCKIYTGIVKTKQCKTERMFWGGRTIANISLSLWKIVARNDTSIGLQNQK